MTSFSVLKGHRRPLGPSWMPSPATRTRSGWPGMPPGPKRTVEDDDDSGRCSLSGYFGFQRRRPLSEAGDSVVERRPYRRPEPDARSQFRSVRALILRSAATCPIVTFGRDTYNATASALNSAEPCCMTTTRPLGCPSTPRASPIHAEYRPCWRRHASSGRAGRTSKPFSVPVLRATMRPVEPPALHPAECHPPDTKWDLLTLHQGDIHAGRNPPGDGTAHETRRLKARAVRDSRPAPRPPTSLRVLQQRLATHGTAPHSTRPRRPGVSMIFLMPGSPSGAPRSRRDGARSSLGYSIAVLHRVYV